MNYGFDIVLGTNLSLPDMAGIYMDATNVLNFFACDSLYNVLDHGSLVKVILLSQNLALSINHQF